MSDARFDDYYAIIPHPTTPSILLLKGENGWSLPMASVPLSPDDGRWRDTFRVNAAFNHLFGISVTVLECLSVSPFPAVGQHGSSVFVLSNHDAEWAAPPEWTWVLSESVATLPFAIPEHRQLLETYLTRTGSAKVDGLPWKRDGWFEEASTWILAQIHSQGLTAIGPIEQTRSWFISSILRVPTSSGDVYFKAIPDSDVHEPLLTRWLATLYPGLVPPVIAVDEERRWLLMKAAPGDKMPRAANPRDYLPGWQRLLQRYALMQCDMAAHLEELFALGCHDWRLESLSESIDPFFVELPLLLQGARHPLSEEEQACLPGLATRLKSACAELARLGIPASVHHGDFHRGNIIVREAECTLLDWAGFVGVAHPFLSLWVPLLDWDEPSQQILCECYLEMWRDYASLEQMRAALPQAHSLAALCGALGHRYQLQHARTSLAWDILGEQEHLLDCLRSLFTWMD